MGVGPSVEWKALWEAEPTGREGCSASRRVNVRHDVGFLDNLEKRQVERLWEAVVTECETVAVTLEDLQELFHNTM